MNKYKPYENVLIEWLPGDWREAVIIEFWLDKYFVQMKNMEVKLTIDELRIKKVKSEHVFF